MLGALLNWPTVCFISKLDIDFKNRQFKACCEWDDGPVNAESTLPAVVSCDLRLNTPSPANMMAIMKAKQKPIETMPLAQLALSISSNQETIQLEKPAVRKGSQKVKSIEELANIIKTIKDGL